MVDGFLLRVVPLVGEDQEGTAHQNVGVDGMGVQRKMQDVGQADLGRLYFRGEEEDHWPDRAVGGSRCRVLPCHEGEVALVDPEPQGEDEAVPPWVQGESSAEACQLRLGVSEEVGLA